MSIRAVVFDVFGTLVHLGDRRRPFRRLLGLMEAAGRPTQSLDAARIMTSNVGLAGAATLFGVDISFADLAILERDLLAELQSARLFPEAGVVLRELADRGMRLGICSNLAAPYALPVRLLLPFELDAYSWSFEVGALKPDPFIYANVCAQLHCEAESVLMVGDTPDADFHGPRECGMRSLLLSRDGLRTNELNAIKDLTGIFATIDRINR